MPSRDDAPVRAKRTTHRIDYTPELIAELRHLYEQTPQTCDRIAATGRISRPTLRVLAQRQGWTRFTHRPLDLSPAVKLEARLAEAEKLRANRDAAPPAADPSPPLASLAGGGESSAAAPENSNSSEPAASAGFDARFRITADAALSEAQAQIEALKAARQQAEDTGRTSQFAHFTRELQSITNSLYRIKRIHDGAGDEFRSNDDTISDLDALRDELARTIDTLVDEWLHARDAGRAQPGEAAADPA
jgi:hypothetical protein